MNISSRDRCILEDLAKRQLELAKSDRNETLKKLWLKSNTLNAERPMVTVELRTFAEEVIPEFLKCEGEKAREIEKMLFMNIANTILFDDDTVVRDYIPIYPNSYILPFNISIVQEFSKSGGVGHHFKEAIFDLERDFYKLEKSAIFLDMKETKQSFEFYNNLLGHILPAKYSSFSFTANLTQKILNIMSMETFFFSMMDYPEKFKKMMDKLSNDFIEYIDLLEENNAFFAMCNDEQVNQGTYAFTDELHPECNNAKNTWFHLNSQESVGISPDMFEEFIFPYYKKIMDRGGLISYGCCEPVDSVWDNCLSKVDNLRKISISAWCNEEIMAEKLKDTKVVYHRKPSPNFIGVGTTLDEAAVRESIGKTVRLNRGRSLEITQREVYTINNDVNKVKRYVEIIREECENNW